MVKKIVFNNNPLMSGPNLVDRETNSIPYREISISAIERDANQPRVSFNEEKLQELADSISAYGVLCPILVRSSKLPNKYILVSGERRLRASKRAGKSSIPAIVDNKVNTDPTKLLAIQIVENVQRDNLSPLEKAHALSALKEAHSLSVREVASKIGISKSSVQRSLDILNLPDDLLNALREGASESKVLLISKIEDKNERSRYLKNIDSFSRDQLKVKKLTTSSTKSQTKSVLSPEDKRIKGEIETSLGLKVSLKRLNNNNGKLVIDFYSENDLREVYRKLTSSE